MHAADGYPFQAEWNAGAVLIDAREISVVLTTNRTLRTSEIIWKHRGSMPDCAIVGPLFDLGGLAGGQARSRPQ
jgi:hypothetical protein